MELTLVLDAAGSIVGVARLTPGESDQGPVNAAIRPLPGQKVQAVELPPELERIDALDDLHKALEGYRLEDIGGVRLIKEEVPE
jgi:hypothetical protein